MSVVCYVKVFLGLISVKRAEAVAQLWAVVACACMLLVKVTSFYAEN